MSAIARLLRLASRSLLVIGGIGLTVMTAIIGWQVFARYVLNASPSWSEQASLVLMIWYVSFAAAAGVKEGFHIRISALVNALPDGPRKTIDIGAQLVVALVGVAMAVWGGELIMRTWEHVIPTLGIPRGAAYLPLPISGVLITLFALENILEILNPAAAGAPEA